MSILYGEFVLLNVVNRPCFSKGCPSNAVWTRTVTYTGQDVWVDDAAKARDQRDYCDAHKQLIERLAQRAQERQEADSSTDPSGN